jgi:hypothetical protein
MQRVGCDNLQQARMGKTVLAIFNFLSNLIPMNQKKLAKIPLFIGEFTVPILSKENEYVGEMETSYFEPAFVHPLNVVDIGYQAIHLGICINAITQFKQKELNPKDN